MALRIDLYRSKFYESGDCADVLDATGIFFFFVILDFFVLCFFWIHVVLIVFERICVCVC